MTIKDFRWLITGFLIGMAAAVSFWMITNPNRANASQIYLKTICHHTPGNQVTLTFHQPQSYAGHLGTPHSGQTYDTNGTCTTPSPSPTASPTATPKPTPADCDHDGDLKDKYEGKECPEVTPTPTPDPCSNPNVDIAELQQDRICASPTPFPSETPQPSLPGTDAGPAFCGDVSTTLLPGNPLVWRNGDQAIVQWVPTDGSQANIYYKQVEQADWQYSVNGIPNNGYFVINGLGTMDITFAIQQTNGGCSGGSIDPANTIVDGPTTGWTLFRP